MAKIRHLITQDNSLIKATYKLDLMEKRLILLAISQSRNFSKIQADTRLEIKVFDYMDVYSVQGRSVYENIKDACKTLLERQFTYHEKQEKGVRVATSKWVSEIAYNDETGAVDLSFAPAVIPLISLLKKHFTSYDLEQVAGLNSKYAVRLYEIVIAWRSQGKTPQIKVKELREQLGVSDDEYTLMADFKRRVLDLAVKEISKHTNITLEYTQHKNGRKIVGFTFEFKYKKGREPKNQDTISLAKGGIYDGIATEPKPTERLTAPIAKPLTEPQAPQVMNANEPLTEREREAVVEVNAYADKIGATPSHRQNLVAKALKESREQEQALATEQAKDIAKKQAAEQKQRQKEQLFNEFWAVASDDDKKALYTQITPYMGVGLHGFKLKQAVKTGDFSQIDDRFASDPLVRERLLAVFKPRMLTEAPYKPTAPQNTPSPTIGGVVPKEPLQAQNKPKSEPQENINQIFNDMTKDEQETVKAQALAYINDNGITDPQEVRTIKKRAVIERWGLDVF